MGLGGGDLLLTCTFDLALGGPGTDRPWVLVEVKAGAARDGNRSDLLWYSLVATLRHGRPPDVVAAWSAADDGLVPVPIGAGSLEAAARRALAALDRLVELAGGREPEVRPNSRCRWCPELDRCAPGLASLDAPRTTSDATYLDEERDRLTDDERRLVSDHRAVGGEWRQRATAEIGQVTSLFPRPPNAKVPWDDIIKLDLHSVRRAARCLRAADPEDEYEETARNARRRVGLAVLARMREDGIDPVAAFRSVLDDRNRLLQERLVGWIDGLGPGGRAALAAEVVTWVAALAALVAARAARPPRRRRAARGQPRLGCARAGGEGARAGGRARAAGRAARRSGASSSSRPTWPRPSWSRATWPSGTPSAGPAPRRRWRCSRRRRGRRGSRWTTTCSARRSSGSRPPRPAAVAARMGPEATATPGWWCQRCALRDECAESAAWRAAHPVRFGGLAAGCCQGGWA